MSVSRIEWTEHTWNPVRGCTRVSPGCVNCYAERMAARFSGNGWDGMTAASIKLQPFAGFAERKPQPHWTGKVELIPEMLEIPLRRKKPTTYFVNSMSDLFHEALPSDTIDRIFRIMENCPQHTFQVLTKRAERMQAFCSAGRAREGSHGWPLPNVWLGVSVEDQIPLLLQTLGAVRFVSLEPLLGPIDVSRWLVQPPYPDARPEMRETYCDKWAHQHPALDWVIVGGESGPGARPCDVGWIRSIVEQCKEAGVPCFVKQLGSHAILDPRYDRSISGWTRRLRDSKGGKMDEWPEDLRVRQLPKAPTGGIAR